MSEKELQLLLKQFDKLEKECNTSEKALNYLIKLGTHNQDGSLTKRYGGTYTL